jgi:putative transposase
MPQSLANVLLHIIFSTKNRQLIIDESIERELNAYVATVSKTSGCPAVKIGCASDHIHILCNMSRTLTIAKLVETIKSDSSAWMKSKGPQYAEFYWQSGTERSP